MWLQVVETIASGLMACDMSRALLSAPTNYPLGVATTALGAALAGPSHARAMFGR